MNKRLITKLILITICITTLLFSFTACNQEDLQDWQAMVQSNYNEFMAEVSSNPDYIPFIVHTDQHGSIKYFSKQYEIINDIVDWSKVSKIINLGDTVESVYSKKELRNYVHATKCLPSDKRIEQIGNHDRTDTTAKQLSKTEEYFVTTSANNSSLPYNYVVEDSTYNVKYIAVDYKQAPQYAYEDGYLDSAHADFIVNELSKVDSYDIILLSHAYIFRDNLIDRNGNTFTGSDYFIGSKTTYTDVKESYVNMLAARKNKTSGVLLDCDGNSHPYDFSNCKGDFLMSIHGHHHTEGYQTYNGITEFLFQSMLMNNGENNEPNCFYFCYIDRETSTFKCWKNVAGYPAYSIKY